MYSFLLFTFITFSFSFFFLWLCSSGNVFFLFLIHMLLLNRKDFGVPQILRMVFLLPGAVYKIEVLLRLFEKLKY